MTTPRREDITPVRSEMAAKALADFQHAERSRSQRIAENIGIAATSAIPWVGGFAAAAKAIRDEEVAGNERRIMIEWLSGHEDRIALLERDVRWIIMRIEQLGDQTQERADRPEFLALVRRGFAGWDRAETDYKRACFARLLVNHAARPLTADDIARLFIDWVDRYHESHFEIISYIYNHPGSTKRDVGVHLFGAPLPVDASAEAGLFRELYRELNMGGLVRDARAIENGSFLKKSRPPRAKGVPASPYMESSFEDDDELELSELGALFVHYVLDEAVIQIGERD